MTRIDTVMIGGGPAGLAMSRCLSDFGIDHVVVERADLDGGKEDPWSATSLT